MERNQNPNNLPVELNRTSLYLGLLIAVLYLRFVLWLGDIGKCLVLYNKLSLTLSRSNSSLDS